MSVFEKGLITVLGCDLLFLLLAIPLALRKVPPNVVYGYRTRKTLGNEAIWYEANAHFGRGLVIAALVSAGLVLVVFALGTEPDLFIGASVAVMAVPTLVAALATARYIRTLSP